MRNIPNVTFLQYFFSAAQAKSISKAAKENYVSQSAISQAINKLELSFGQQLITHEKNRFQLTPEGVLLLDKCKQIFTMFSEIEDTFNETEGVYKGKLSVACTHSFALSQLPTHLGKLSQLCPQVEPVLRFGHSGTVADLVKKGEVDFGIVLDNDDFTGFQSQEIYRGKYRLYHAKKPSKLAMKKFILSEERREVSCLKEHLIKQGTEVSSFIEVFSWEVIASLAEQGLGVGFLPDYVVCKKSLIPAKIKMPDIPYRLLAIYPKNKNLFRNAKNVYRPDVQRALIYGRGGESKTQRAKRSMGEIKTQRRKDAKAQRGLF